MPRDMILNSDYEITAANDDFVMGESTRQHQEQLLVNAKGAFKLSPLTGVGIDEFVQDDRVADMLREIKEQFINDGMINVDVQLSDDKLYVNGEYSS